jgi:uncharacterized protein
MTTNYLDAARQGRNKWWQYVLELTIVPFAAMMLVTIILIICLLAFGVVNISDLQNKELVRNTLETMPLWALYLLYIPLYSSACGSMLVGIEVLHHRKALSVICPGRTFDIKRYFNALTVWFLMSLFLNIFQYIFNPQNFKLVFDPIQWLMYLVPNIILSFVLALFQEIVRGYVLQGLGLITRHKFLLIFMSVFLSLLMSLSSNSHSIQPQSTIFDFIFCIGLVATILKDNGLELVLGIQTAIGLLKGFISYQFPDKISPFSTIWKVNLNMQIHPSVINIGIVILLIKLTTFYIIFLRKTKPDLNVPQNSG